MSDLVNNSEIIYFYFDTVKSQLKIEDFNQLVKSLDIVTNNVTNVFFDEKSKCEILILPPEDGSFKSKFCIFLAGAVFSTAVGNYGEGWVQELTGHDYKYYGQEHCKLVKEVTISLFSNTTSYLMSVIPKQVNLDSSLKAKSDFYLTIANDDNIKSLGFSEDDKTQIARTDFGAYICNDLIRDIDNIEEYAQLTIVKPVTVQSAYVWTLRDVHKQKNDDYNILDEDFKKLIWDGENPLKQKKEPDQILAKVEYVKEMKNGKETVTQTNIKEVYKFNDKDLKKLPSDFKVNEPKSQKKNIYQASLFDELEGFEHLK